MSPLNILFVLNEKGEAVPESDPAKWGAWFSKSGKQRQIALSEIEQSILPGKSAPILVSTIFVGINANPFANPPSLWESMIFGGKYNNMCVRYNSQELALQGHQNLVKDIEEELVK